MERITLDEPIHFKEKIRRSYSSVVEVLLVFTNAIAFCFGIYWIFSLDQPEGGANSSTMLFCLDCIMVVTLMGSTILPIMYILKWRKFSMIYDTHGLSDFQGISDDLGGFMIYSSIFWMTIFVIITVYLLDEQASFRGYEIWWFFECVALVLGIIIQPIYAWGIAKVIQGLKIDRNNK